MNYTGTSKTFCKRWILTSDSLFPIEVTVYRESETWYFPGRITLSQKSYDTRDEAIIARICHAIDNIKVLKDELCKQS